MCSTSIPKEPWTNVYYFCQQSNSKLLSSSLISICTFLSFTVLVMDRVSCTFGPAWSLHHTKKHPWEAQIYRVHVLPSSLINKGTLLHGAGRKSLLGFYPSVLSSLYVQLQELETKKRKTQSVLVVFWSENLEQIFTLLALDGDDSGQVELPSCLWQPTSESFFM